MTTRTRKPVRKTRKRVATKRKSSVKSAADPMAANPEDSVSGTPEKGRVKKSDKAVRDSFTMPAPDYALIGMLKKRCLSLGVAVKKSELLRVGLAAIDRLPDGRLIEAVTPVVNARLTQAHGKKAAKQY